MGDLLGNNQKAEQRRNLRKQEEIAGQQQAIFGQYVPNTLATLAGMAGERPGWLEGAGRQANAAIERGMDRFTGRTVVDLQRRGLTQSAATPNLLATIARGGAEAYGQTAQRLAETEDERRQKILMQILSLATGQGAGATATYGRLGSQWGEMADQAVAGLFDVGSLLGGAGVFGGGGGGPKGKYNY